MIVLQIAYFLFGWCVAYLYDTYRNPLGQWSTVAVLWLWPLVIPFWAWQAGRSGKHYDY